MTAGSEADRDSATADLPDIDPRHSLRTAATITAAFAPPRRADPLIVLLLSDDAGAGSSTASIVNYHSSDDRRRVVLVGLYVTSLAGIAFI